MLPVFGLNSLNACKPLPWLSANLSFVSSPTGKHFYLFYQFQVNLEWILGKLEHLLQLQVVIIMKRLDILPSMYLLLDSVNSLFYNQLRYRMLKPILSVQ